MLLAATVLASSVYAGGPDVMAAPQHQDPTLFATAEGGYSWNSVGDTTIVYDGIGGTVAKSDEGATARVAVGGIHYTTNPNLSYTGEIGGGYYGKNTFGNAARGIDARNYYYGLDLLAGVDYKVNNMFDIFAKFGGLLENIRMVRNYNLSLLTSDVTGSDNETSTAFSFAPELKLGAVYNIDSVWGLSASYLHVFGNDVSMSINKTQAAGVTTAVTSSQTGGPVSLNTILAGVVYKFN